MRASISTEMLRQIPTSIHETSTFVFPKTRPLRMEGYIKGRNNAMIKNPSILFSRIPSKNRQKPIKLMAEAMKAGATHRMWMRMATDGNKMVCMPTFETNIINATLRSENK